MGIETMSRRLVLGTMLFLALLNANGIVARADAHKAEAVQGDSGQAGEQKPAGNPAERLNPIFPFDFGLSFWTVIVFLLAMWILKRYAWGPISEGLQKREDGIAGQIADAQRRNEEAKQLLADYERKLAAAHDEVRSLIEQGRRDAEKVGQQVMEKAREESAIERQRSLQQIEAATSAALKELADRSAALAVELAGKIVGAQLNAADHSRLIEQSVAQFARSKQVNAN